MLMRTHDRDDSSHHAMEVFVSTIIELIDAKIKPLQDEIARLRAEVSTLRELRDQRNGNSPLRGGA